MQVHNASPALAEPRPRSQPAEELAAGELQARVFRTGDADPEALAQSLNTVCVRLTLEFGPTAVVRTAHRLGIASKLEPNASIALGTLGVSMLERYRPMRPSPMAGTPSSLTSRNAEPLGRVVGLRYVAMMRETLTSGTARKADLPGWAAVGKTGTSQDFRDVWFVGYTSRLVIGVWLGNDDSSPTRKATGGGLPVEVWSQFMKAAHQGKPATDLPLMRTGLAPRRRRDTAASRSGRPGD
jgi:penicillin-binding protein 1A